MRQVKERMDEKVIELQQRCEEKRKACVDECAAPVSAGQ